MSKKNISMKTLEEKMKNTKKKKVLILPLGMNIGTDKVKKILKSYDIYVDYTKSSSNAYTAIDSNENETFLTKVSETDPKKMKKLSKKRSFLFIPGFRKSKKTTKYSEDISAEGQLVSGYENKDPSLLSECKIKDSDSGKDSDSIGSISSRESFDSKEDNFSIQSSSSSLRSIAEEQRTSSLDSGIDCMPLRYPGREFSKSNLMMNKEYVIEEQVRGRAPIASPEDDSLLENNTSHKDSDNSGYASNNSVASFHTLSDSSSCSCDSCCDSSDSDDEEDTVKHSRFRSSSDSDSDLGSHSQSRKYNDESSDSDSDIDECSGFFTQSQNKCFLPSSHQGVRSSASSGAVVHSNSVNKKNVVKKKVKTNGILKQFQKLKVVRGHQHKLFSPSPVCSSSIHCENNMSTPIKQPEDVSSFFMNSESAFHSYHSKEPLYVNQGSHDIFDSKCHSLCRLDKSLNSKQTNAGNAKLTRSVSMCERSSRPKLRSPTLQVRDRSLNKELLQDKRDAGVCEPLLLEDSSKTLADVQQSIEKTAFWIENNGYDSKPDENTTKSLLKKKEEVSERDLCNEIIGVYFGEESDSSLSSSCLDNSIEQEGSSTTSSDDCVIPPRTIETNIDDFSTATYVPAPYQTAQAKTRKIRTDELLEKVKPVEQRSLGSKQTRIRTSCKQPPMQGKKSSSSTSEKKQTFLSEQEVDTITKLHTLCNGQRVVQYLNTAETPMIHFPPPKRASRISWNRELEQCKMAHHSPRNTPTKPKSALRKRPNDCLFPYVEDKPSPIVITRVRRSKSMSHRSREWPW